jgi:hypothetical protein
MTKRPVAKGSSSSAFRWNGASTHQLLGSGDQTHRPPLHFLEFVGSLDDIDLSGQVGGDLETNFLLTNCGLCPNLHSILLLNKTGGRSIRLTPTI